MFGELFSSMETREYCELVRTAFSVSDEQIAHMINNNIITKEQADELYYARAAAIQSITDLLMENTTGAREGYEEYRRQLDEEKNHGSIK